MSSHVVNISIVTDVVATLYFNAVKEEHRGLAPLGVATIKDGDDAARLVAAIHWMNCEATGGCYPHDPYMGEPDTIFGGPMGVALAGVYKRIHYRAGSKPPLNPIQTYKYLRCILYQCAEGAVPDSDLYQELEAYADRLAVAIVETSPAYDNAKWA